MLDNSDPVRLEAVLEALHRLPPRYERFIRLDLVNLLPPDEIQRRLGLHSRSHFRRLKVAAFSALLHELEGAR